MSCLGAIILSGGASKRMGVDKGSIAWLGERAIERVAGVAAAVGCGVVITVGPTDYGLPFVVDDTPLGGPVGGVLAGASALLQRGCDRALVLPVDAPTVRITDLQPLMRIGGSGAAFDGFPLPLSISLAALPSDASAGWPMKRLVEHAGLKVIDCPADARLRLRGANTPDEREILLRELAGYEATRKYRAPDNS
jgi:molybdopterin-guanine dinucleotide biosynthesis protein A